MEDPRTAFRAGQDRQVLVSFEWQGPAGRHRCEGAWKDPTGRVVFTSDSQVDARGPRFAVYWGLSVPDTVATGNWVLEAKIDGEPAGAHAFQFLSDPSAPIVPARRALSLAELYQRGLADTLTLEALDASGAHLRVTSGFTVAPGLVATSFAGINAARSVRLITPDERRLETSEVVSWNRHDDWAYLRFPGAAGQALTRAEEDPRVGDRCFFLDAQGEGGRVIVDTTVVGRAPNGDLRLADLAGDASHGAPVFNEYGDVVAALAGSGIPGASLLDLMGLGEASRQILGRGSRARPLAPATDPGGASRTLQELEAAGEFILPLARTPHFVQGVLGTGVERQGRAQIPVASDQRFRFSRREQSCVVFVTWTPARKQDSTVAFELFNADNKRIGNTDPAKARLRPAASFVQYWTIPLSPLGPGIYRVDVKLGPDPVWRTFFRVTD